MLCASFKWSVPDQDTGMLTHFLFLQCQISGKRQADKVPGARRMNLVEFGDPEKLAMMVHEQL